MEQFTQPTTAVPLEVQRVLDAMTSRNWVRSGDAANGRLCFLLRARFQFNCNVWGAGEGDDTVWVDLHLRCRRLYGLPPEKINDNAASLSEFKSKIAALYTEAV